MLDDKALRLKKKLAAGEPTGGIWINLPSPAAAEIIAGAGYDWVMVDSEHCTFNPETLMNILMAFNGSETVPLVRVAWNDHVLIKQVLDMGYNGIVVPQVNTAEEARRVVAACKYAPLGNRGWGPFRSGGYGRQRQGYASLANESVICIIQVEDASEVDKHIDEIVRTPGIDGIWVGRNDMSCSIGKPLDVDNPLVWNAVHKVFAAAKAANIPTGAAYEGLETVDKALELGCQWILLGRDSRFLVQAADGTLKAFKEVVGRTNT